MKFLIVLFYLVDGSPRGADVLGIAPDKETCAQAGVDVLTSKQDAVRQLIEQGVRPQIHCIPAPEFDPKSRALVI